MRWLAMIPATIPKHMLKQNLLLNMRRWAMIPAAPPPPTTTCIKKRGAGTPDGLTTHDGTTT